MFVDRVKIKVEAGAGGNGCVSFRRERYVAKGGPNGGDGGRGGSVIFVAEAGVDSLTALAHKKHHKAKGGRPGEGSDRTGRGADDIIIKLPPGTVVIDANEHFVLKDMNQAGDKLIAAQGGKGGRGNASFKSATNRAPREFTAGIPGESRTLILELKVIADVGLIGKPNAGKSTLLSRLSRAQPEIADYPFTTKFPNLGQVQIDLDRSFILADIPGLIEGASEGVGLGHEFLRHVERAGILVHLVEPMPTDGTDPMENYRAIRHELGAYDEQLGKRFEIICVSKAELPGSQEVRDQLAEETGNEVLLMSAVTGAGLNQVIHAIDAALQKHREQEDVS
ncbi:MAG: GTPase ObgE [Blastopirellula sp.]|nr:MAG: GTPase ObgE [Blastopirellula sp.]